MEKEPIYTNSILTFAFTADGRVIVLKDKEEKLDTLPLCFMGYREKGAKINYEDSIYVINSRDDYIEAIADFFSYYGKETHSAFVEQWIKGNPTRLWGTYRFD